MAFKLGRLVQRYKCLRDMLLEIPIMGCRERQIDKGKRASSGRK
jgi:hypothetical protein